MKGDLEALEELLDSGVSPDSQDEEGWSALHHAAQAGTSLKREFREIDYTWDNNHGFATSGHASIMNCLLHHGASPEAATLDGDTPLHFAATDGCVPIIELLVNAGANVNTQVKLPLS